MKRQIKKQFVIWVVCLIIFLLSLYVGGIQNGPFNENPSPIKNIAFVSLFASISIGVLSFLSLMYQFVGFAVSRGESKKKNVLKSIFLFIITAPIFPLYVLVLVIKSLIINKPRVKDLRWLVLGVNVLILIPVWLVAYIATYYVATDEAFLGLRYQMATINDMDSMAPSFPGKSIHKYYPYKNIVYKLDKSKAYKFQRGDVIAFSTDITRAAIAKSGLQNYYFFKRIIALPGDTVEMKNGAVFINDKPIMEPYTMEPNSTLALPGKYEWSKQNGLGGLFLQDCQEVTVPDHKLFVLGDNRKNSDDSRIIGFVDFDDVVQYLPFAEQKVTYYEGVTPINHSEKWRDASNDYQNLIQAHPNLCPGK